MEDPPVTAGVEAPGVGPGFEPPCEAGVDMLPTPPLVAPGEPFVAGALVAGILDGIEVGGIVYVVVASGALVAATASTSGAV